MNRDTVKSNDIARKLQFVGLDETQRQALSALKPMIDEMVGPALDKFYDKVRATPETARFFRDDDQISHAKSMQQGHWSLIASGAFDQNYVDAVTRVGKVHARLGLEPNWYIGGYTHILEALLTGIISKKLGGFGRTRKVQETGRDLSAVVKAALIDMDYAISVYLEVLAQERAEVEMERARAKGEQDAALGALQQALVRMADGDLSAGITEPLATEFDGLKENYNGSIAKLSETFAEIIGATRQAVSDTRELSGATDDMARRTEQQAAALEQTAAAIEQITTISSQSADRTGEARRVVEQTSQEATDSVKTVEQAVDAMGKIEQSSKKITQIITVIDEISFQTNLLALNAGVEAARAGEAGRGFAVVAQEVRELAQRSAAAAKEIKELIETSYNDVVHGVSLVNKTGEALDSIGGQVRVISDHFVSISQSAQEQAAGIAEINQAVSSMDLITQQNASMVEQTNAATHNLLQINQNLAELTGRFTVSGQASASAGWDHTDRAA